MLLIKTKISLKKKFFSYFLLINIILLILFNIVLNFSKIYYVIHLLTLLKGNYYKKKNSLFKIYPIVWTLRKRKCSIYRVFLYVIIVLVSIKEKCCEY